MSDAEDLAAIMTALNNYQDDAMQGAMKGLSAPRRHLECADVAILALERIRTRLANSVPAEQARMEMEEMEA